VGQPGPVRQARDCRLAGQTFCRLCCFVRGESFRSALGHASNAGRTLLPRLVFVPLDFTRYRAVSRSVREIFKRHTDLIEPLSLDEAYLHVTDNKDRPADRHACDTHDSPTNSQELNLTGSAGVAPNKFLAKSRLIGANAMDYLLSSPKT
jgi:nucleotidyltransferase/DNA polymerase involved in DNA repair